MLTFASDDGDPRIFKDSLKKKLHKVGVISVRFYWVTASATHNPRVTVRKNKNIGVVPEKALKGSALSHQARSASVFPDTHKYLYCD